MSLASSSITVGDIGEFSLISRIDAILDSGRREEGGSASTGQGVVLDRGDDAALIRPMPGFDLVLTCDVLVAGRHFVPHWMSGVQIGRRAMTANLSDIAAMGALPAHVLVSLGLPRSMPVSEVEDLYRGFLLALDDSGAAVIGGNISGSGMDWFCDITMIGRIRPDCALTRSGARPGDRILVTGSPGRSMAGLSCLQRLAEQEDARLTDPDPERFEDYRGVLDARSGVAKALSQGLRRMPWMDELIRAFLEPTARVDSGRRLSSWNEEADREGSPRPVTAMLDISDGLPGDLLHICERSGVGARLSVPSLPIDNTLDEASRLLGRKRYEWSLLPSDDYELLFTCRPEASAAVRERLESESGVRVSEIGEILAPEDQEGDRLLIDGLPPGSEPPSGWDHFRSGRKPGESGEAGHGA